MSKVVMAGLDPRLSGSSKLVGDLNTTHTPLGRARPGHPRLLSVIRSARRRRGWPEQVRPRAIIGGAFVASAFVDHRVKPGDDDPRRMPLASVSAALGRHPACFSPVFAGGLA